MKSRRNVALIVETSVVYGREILQNNRVYMNQIITHRMGVSEIQHAFELFFAGEIGKVIIQQ